MPVTAAPINTDASAAPASRPVLRLVRVGKSFTVAGGGRIEVLQDIDLTVEEGQIHALLGRSGCGKSTLLNIIAGLLAADRGAVRINGHERGARGPDPDVGYVFQDDRLMPWRSARDNVAFALENRPGNRRERQAKADEMLTLVGLTGFEQAFPSQLSGGMRSRVALARALVRRPRLLIMDEPFSRLDAETRSAMHREILRLRELLGTTVLFVTHDVEEAAVLADHVTVLRPRPGRIASVLPVHRLLPGDGTLRDGTDPAVVAVMRQLKAALIQGSAPIDPDGPGNHGNSERN
jgi:ABC-type nitrate/sulfonate/bicarbonate transport system ATPase subunit